MTFLVVGLIAGVLGVSGVAGAATYIAYVLFVVFLSSAPLVSLLWAGGLLPNLHE